MKRDELGRRLTPVAEREAAVEAYEKSGLSCRAYARRAGINYVTLIRWVRWQREKTAVAGPAFAEFTLPGASGLEVRWPDGVVIRGMNVEDAAKLLRLVRC
ncbi:MAG: IS66 family insertion sequence element accessory protein TnpA [Verrucomicrobiota bacterium]